LYTDVVRCDQEVPVTRTIRKFLAVAALAATLPYAVVACGGDDTAVNPTDGGCKDAADAGCNNADADAAVDAKPDVTGIDVGDGGPSFNLWPASGGPIKYWGGPVILGCPNVYFVWYGNWKGSNTPAVLEDLIKGFGETGYSNILKAYYQTPQVPKVDAGSPDAADLDGATDASVDADVPDGPKEYVSGRVCFSRSIYVGYTRGTHLGQGDVRGVVTDLLRSNDLPYDPTAVYFVLASSDVTESDGFAGFCSDYCGWHNGHVIDSVPIQYSFVGDPASCLDGCGLTTQFADAGILKSPNDNWSADSMASVIIHELSEAITDPQPYDGPAWQDQYMSAENGDMCAWRFDPTYPTLNGSRANVRFGSRDYLIQQMWVIDSDGGRCDLQP
jgi:hypothetical protein